VRGEDVGRPLGGVALPDPAEIQVNTGVELDPVAVDADAAAARAAPRRRIARAVAHLVERPVVAGRDESVVHRRVEATFGPLARRERELDDPGEVGHAVDATVAVQARKRRVRPEAREDSLEPLELALDCDERPDRRRLVRGLDDRLDLGAHGVEDVARHQDEWLRGRRRPATLPPALDTCLFVNSGSEANHLAWRFASAVTGAPGAVVSDWAYHGVTTIQTDLSPSEWRGERPAWVATVSPPGTDGAAAGSNAVERLAENGLAPAAFFLDAAWTSDGVFTDAPGYTADAVAEIRGAGGLFVADEVQAGFGRLGTHLWSFEPSGVGPDLVTFGKPMGNGHPVAAMVTTSETADRFAEVRAPVFSTFGGNPVACAAALAVLDVMDEERLLERAAVVGAHLRRGLEDLAGRNESVRAVRGIGLLHGVELESPELAEKVLNAMRDRGVLIGLTGPRDEVLKIRPPLVFEHAHAERLVEALDESLRSR